MQYLSGGDGEVCRFQDPIGGADHFDTASLSSRLGSDTTVEIT
jgi:hypothetical protein